MDKRQNVLTRWVSHCYPNKTIKINPLAGDASFRRYFRITVDDETVVAMDAPPSKEGLEPFIVVANALNKAGIPCPQVLFQDISLGFLLLSDCGDDLMLSIVNEGNADSLYHQAIDQIIELQAIKQIDNYSIPLFDSAYQYAEMALFHQWFLGEYLNISLSDKQLNQLEQTFKIIISQTSKQPQTLIHRDYHSRNLLLNQRLSISDLGVRHINYKGLSISDLGVRHRSPHLYIIDFQDAMIGPYSYDLVSLIKDCYIEWPQSRRDSWIEYFLQHSQYTINLKQLKKDVDFCGMQRHLKVLGIFARLYLRDNKPSYLQDIPLTLKYLQQAAENYKELDDLTNLLKPIKLPERN